MKVKQKNLISVFLFLLATGCRTQGETTGLSWWVWLLIIVLLLLLFWLLFKSQPKNEDGEMKTVLSDSEVGESETMDDLKLIEGIGPKINDILHEAHVKTFSQLASMQPDEIMQILTAAGLRLADTSTWPEQAAMAATGDLEALKAYQDTLTAGRIT